MPAAESDVHALRRVDWRFLLPDPELRRVLLPSSVVPRYGPGLEADGVEVVPLASAVDAEGRPADVVAAPADARLVGALLRGRPDLPVYVELDRRALLDRRWWALLRRYPVSRFLAVPGHDRRRAFVPLAEPRPLGWLLAAEGGLPAAAAGAGLVDTSIVRAAASGLAPARAVVFSPRPALHSIGAWLADRGILAPGGGAPASHLLVTPRFSTSRHVVALAGREHPEVVVKTTRLAGSGIDREAEALRELWDRTAGRDTGAPRLIAHERWGRRTVIVETAVQGEPLTAERAAEDPARAAADLTGWVLRLPRRGPTGAADRISALLTAPLERLAALGGPEKQLVQATHAAIAHLAARDLPVTFEHGDVSAPNVIRTGAGLALVDWELAEPSGLPAHDLFIALGFVARALGRRGAAPALERAFLGAPPWWVRTEVDRYRRTVGVPPGVTAALFLCCWARVTAALAERARLEGGDMSWLRSQPAAQLWRAAVEHPMALAWMP